MVLRCRSCRCYAKKMIMNNTEQPPSVLKENLPRCATEDVDRMCAMRLMSHGHLIALRRCIRCEIWLYVCITLLKQINRIDWRRATRLEWEFSALRSVRVCSMYVSAWMSRTASIFVHWIVGESFMAIRTQQRRRKLLSDNRTIELLFEHTRATFETSKSMSCT